MNILDEKMIFTDLEFDSSEEVIGYMGRAMESHGYVKNTYTEAVIAREKLYPTGLPGCEFSIAVPHTDPEHVNKAVIAIGILKRPVDFAMMGNPKEFLKCKVVFCLAIDDVKNQIETLKRLMRVIQDKELLKEIANVKNIREIIGLLKDLG